MAQTQSADHLEFVAFVEAAVRNAEALHTKESRREKDAWIARNSRPLFGNPPQAFICRQLHRVYLGLRTRHRAHRIAQLRVARLLLGKEQLSESPF